MIVSSNTLNWPRDSKGSARIALQVYCLFSNARTQVGTGGDDMRGQERRDITGKRVAQSGIIEPNVTYSGGFHPGIGVIGIMAIGAIVAFLIWKRTKDQGMAYESLSYDDYKEAIEGEGWAIGDYAGMISDADTNSEKKVLKHIRDEEKEHLDELQDLLRQKKIDHYSAKRPKWEKIEDMVDCPHCGEENPVRAPDPWHDSDEWWEFEVDEDGTSARSSSGPHMCSHCGEAFTVDWMGNAWTPPPGWGDVEDSVVLVALPKRVYKHIPKITKMDIESVTKGKVEHMDNFYPMVTAYIKEGFGRDSVVIPFLKAGFKNVKLTIYLGTNQVELQNADVYKERYNYSGKVKVIDGSSFHDVWTSHDWEPFEYEYEEFSAPVAKITKNDIETITGGNVTSFDALPTMIVAYVDGASVPGFPFKNIKLTVHMGTSNIELRNWDRYRERYYYSGPIKVVDKDTLYAVYYSNDWKGIEYEYDEQPEYDEPEYDEQPEHYSSGRSSAWHRLFKRKEIPYPSGRKEITYDLMDDLKGTISGIMPYVKDMRETTPAGKDGFPLTFDIVLRDDSVIEAIKNDKWRTHWILKYIDIGESFDTKYEKALSGLETILGKKFHELADEYEPLVAFDSGETVNRATLRRDIIDGLLEGKLLRYHPYDWPMGNVEEDPNWHEIAISPHSDSNHASIGSPVRIGESVLKGGGKYGPKAWWRDRSKGIIQLNTGGSAEWPHDFLLRYKDPAKIPDVKRSTPKIPEPQPGKNVRRDKLKEYVKAGLMEGRYKEKVGKNLLYDPSNVWYPVDIDEHFTHFEESEIRDGKLWISNHTFEGLKNYTAVWSRKVVGEIVLYPLAYGGDTSYLLRFRKEEPGLEEPGLDEPLVAFEGN